jgi:hypothetical protein
MNAGVVQCGTCFDSARRYQSAVVGHMEAAAGSGTMHSPPRIRGGDAHDVNIGDEVSPTRPLAADRAQADAVPEFEAIVAPTTFVEV